MERYSVAVWGMPWAGLENGKFVHQLAFEFGGIVVKGLHRTCAHLRAFCAIVFTAVCS